MPGLPQPSAYRWRGDVLGRTGRGSPDPRLQPREPEAPRDRGYQTGARAMNAIVAADNIERAIDDAENLFVMAGRAKVKAEAEDLRRKRKRAALYVKYKGQ